MSMSTLFFLFIVGLVFGENYFIQVNNNSLALDPQYSGCVSITCAIEAINQINRTSDSDTVFVNIGPGDYYGVYTIGFNLSSPLKIKFVGNGSTLVHNTRSYFVPIFNVPMLRSNESLAFSNFEIVQSTQAKYYDFLKVKGDNFYRFDVLVDNITWNPCGYTLFRFDLADIRKVQMRENLIFINISNSRITGNAFQYALVDSPRSTVRVEIFNSIIQSFAVDTGRANRDNGIARISDSTFLNSNFRWLTFDVTVNNCTFLNSSVMILQFLTAVFENSFFSGYNSIIRFTCRRPSVTEYCSVIFKSSNFTDITLKSDSTQRNALFNCQSTNCSLAITESKFYSLKNIILLDLCRPVSFGLYSSSLFNSYNVTYLKRPCSDKSNINVLLSNVDFYMNEELFLNIPSEARFQLERTRFFSNKNVDNSALKLYAKQFMMIDASFISNSVSKSPLIYVENDGYGEHIIENMLVSYSRAAQNNGGVIYLGLSSHLLLRNALIQNASSISGSSIFALGKNNLTVENSTFIGSISLASGGAILLSDNSILYVFNSHFINCASGANGGSIFLGASSTFYAFHSKFEGSYASVFGGSFFLSGYSRTFLEFCDIYNSTGFHGGSFYLQSNSLISLRSSNLCYNLAYTEGGAIYANFSVQVMFFKSVFFKNVALNGGLLYCIGNCGVISNHSVAESNEASEYGGVIWSNRSALEFYDSVIVSNRALSGGALFLGKTSSLSSIDSAFLNNSATVAVSIGCSKNSGIGGVLYAETLEDVSFQISKSSFASNYAQLFGNTFGAFRALDASTLDSIISSNSIFNDRARGNGISTWIRNAKIWLEIDRVYQSEEFAIYLRLQDYLGKVVFVEYCSFVVHAQLNSSLYAYETLLESEPRDVAFADSNRNVSLGASYRYNFRFSFANAILQFPKADAVLNYSIWITIEALGSVIQSNFVHIDVLLCPAGYALEADVVRFYTCVPCLAGAFANSSASWITRCSKCPSGKFSSALSTDCTSCPKGQFSGEEGQAYRCIDCPAGTFASLESQTHCQRCIEGEFNDRSGSSFCSKCPSSSTTFEQGSSSIRDCVCPSGKFGVAGEGDCRDCPNYKGLSCEKNSSVPFVFEGYWRNPDDPIGVQKCFPEFACLASGFESSVGCLPGYTGVRCGQCESGRFRSSQECLECPSHELILFVFVAIILSFVAILVYVLITPSKSTSRFSIRAILSAVQAVGVLSRFLDQTQQSKTLSWILTFLDLSNFNLEILFAFDCLSELEFWSLFSLKIFFIVLMFAVVCGSGFLLTRCWKGKDNKQASPIQKSISFFLMILSTLFFYVLSSILSIFRCYPQDDGSFTLLSSPSYNCYDKQWLNYFFVIFLGICIVIAVPFTIGMILFKNRNQRYSNQFYFKYAFLTRPYKAKFYYWEVIALLWKTVYVCLVDLTNGWQKFERVFLLIFFISLHVYSDSIIKPYDSSTLPMLEIRTIWQLISILLILKDALFFRDSISFDQDTSTHTLDALLCMIILFALIYSSLRLFITLKANQMDSGRSFFYRYFSWCNHRDRSSKKVKYVSNPISKKNQNEKNLK